MCHKLSRTAASSVCLVLAIAAGNAFSAEGSATLAAARSQWSGRDSNSVTTVDHQTLVSQLEVQGIVAPSILIRELQMIDPPSPFPKQDVAAALGHLRAPGLSAELLKTALSDKYSAEPLLMAISISRDQAVIPSLVSALKLNDEVLAGLVVQTLQSFANDRLYEPPVASELEKALNDSNDLVKYHAIDVMRGCNSPRFKSRLIAIVNSGSETDGIKAAALRALDGWRAGAEMQKAVLHAVSNLTSATVAKDAALTLGRWRNVESIPLLIDLLSSKNEGVKLNARWALRNVTGLNTTLDPAGWKRWLEASKLSEKSTLDGIIAKLENGPVATRPLAVESMESIVLLRDKAVVALRPHLRDTDYRVRSACLNVIGQFGDISNCAEMLENLRDPKPEVSYTAWRAMKDITSMDMPRDYNVWAAWLRDIQR